MKILENTISFATSDGLSEIDVRRFTPVESAACGIVLFIHGEGGFTRYCKEAAELFCRAGYVVFAPELLLDGKTALKRTRGNAPATAAGEYLASDVLDVLGRIRAKYRNLPLFLCGVGTGALIAQIVMAECAEKADGAVFVAPLRRGHAGFLKERSFYGSIAKAKDGFSIKTERIFFETTAGKGACAGNKENTYPGLPAVVYGYFYRLMRIVGSPEFPGRLPKNKAYLFIADKRDVLSGNGADCLEMTNELAELDFSEVTCRLYPGENMSDGVPEPYGRDELVSQLKSEIVVWLNEWTEAVIAARTSL